MVALTIIFITAALVMSVFLLGRKVMPTMFFGNLKGFMRTNSIALIGVALVVSLFACGCLYGSLINSLPYRGRMNCIVEPAQTLKH